MSAMHVTHTLRASALCPVDGTVDVYDVRVETDRQIDVEAILAVLADVRTERIYQEDLTLRVQNATGAKVTTVGVHSGVTTTVTAGP